VRRQTVESLLAGFIAHQADEFREIDVGRTADAALGTGQAVPDGIIGKLLQFIKRALYNLSG
jgi:hypothetical protein